MSLWEGRWTTIEIQHIMNRSNLLIECHNEDCFSGVLPFLAAAYRSDFDHQVHFINLVDLLSIAEN
jgi:hypothetical protein